MLESFKEVLTKDIELEKLKDVLESEIRLKEFLLHNVEIRNLVTSKKNQQKKSTHSNDSSLKSYDMGRFLQDYDDKLIDSLKNDHKELLFLYDQIIKNAKAKKFTLVSVHLETFKTLLTQHYHKADQKLYGYLELFIRHKHPKRQQAFDALSQEMKKISISIFYSLSETVEIKLSNDSYYCFMCSFTKLGKELNKRIHQEVTLLHNMYEESNITPQSFINDNAGQEM